MRKRPSWQDYLLGLAWCARGRSPDEQTRHGCCLANDRHQVLGLGYNGFPRGADDEGLPATRPEKYDWVDHAEENAVANCQLRPEAATAYVTGPPCFACLKEMWRHGVKKVVHLAGYGWQKDGEEAALKERFLRMTGMEVVAVEADLSWLRACAAEAPGPREVPS